MAQKSNLESSAQTPSIQPPTPFQMMIRAMANDAEADDGVFTGDDLNELLTAENESELWAADERPPLNFQHLAGCEIAILDFAVKFSRGGKDGIVTPFVHIDEKGKERKMYLLATCVRLSDPTETSIIKLPAIGEVFQANTSARFVVAKMWRAMILGMIDESKNKQLECIVQATDLGDGQAVLKLRPIPNRSVRATVS